MRIAVAFPALALALALAAPCAAQEGPAFGMVNLPLLYNFHPLVQTYVPSEGKFMRLDGGLDFKKRYETQRDDIRRMQIRIGDLYKQVKALEEEKSMAQMRRWQERRRIETDLDDWAKNPGNAGKPYPELDKAKERLRKIEEELFAETKAFDEKKAKFEREAEAENEKIKAINFLVGADHDKQIERISGEIGEAVGRVVAAKRLAGVFNSGRFHRVRRAEGTRGSFDFRSVYNPAYEQLPENIYSAGNSVQEAIDSHAEMGPEMVKYALDAKLERFRKRMENADALLAPFETRNLNDIVVSGGVDVTADALDDLLRRYKVEEATRELIVKGVREKKIY